jgi:hypothetical protein
MRQYSFGIMSFLFQLTCLHRFLPLQIYLTRTCKRLRRHGSIPRNRFRQAGNRYLGSLKSLQIPALHMMHDILHYISPECLCWIYTLILPFFSTYNDYRTRYPQLQKRRIYCAKYTGVQRSNIFVL